MQSFLRAETLSEALCKYHDYPNYKVGVIFASEKRARDFPSKMQDSILQGKIPELLICHDIISETIRFRFQNGSEIESILGAANARGRARHEILLDFIPKGYEKQYLSQAIVPYLYDDDTDVDDDAKELEEFLNGFTVR